MNSQETLNKAFRIIAELMNEDCFDFEDVKELNFNERKDFLRVAISTYFSCGESNLGGVIERVFDNTKATEENINKFFENEELIADIILFMDEDMYFEYEKELNLR